jgi:signal transduction histidine kinase
MGHRRFENFRIVNMEQSTTSPLKPRGLSSKVLLLTIIFVMIGEVLIFLPSIANFRIQWFKARIAQAEIAALAAEAAPDQILNSDLQTEILKGAGVIAVSLKRGETRQLMLRDVSNAMVEESYDLRNGLYYNTVGQAFSALISTKDRVIGVIDTPPNMSGDVIDIAVNEQPLSIAMRRYGLNILLLSVVLSLIVASLIFAALNRLLVRPIERLSKNMTHFGEKPEDASRIILPTARNDEIGTAERQLNHMQTDLQSLLQQKSHLAALGLAVSKVSHDLRNMLTSAQLISDRLATVNDPDVKRFAPKLIGSLDRAISFLNQTLTFGQAKERPPRREIINVQQLVSEVFDGFLIGEGTSQNFVNTVPMGVTIDADREQLSRVLNNLVRNAVQACAAASVTVPEISITATRRNSTTEIEVQDNGPGIPAAIRDKVFEAFQTSARAGGTGLGLAISAELVAAHGGTLIVAQTNATGTTFRISIADRMVIVEKPRQANFH